MSNLDWLKRQEALFKDDSVIEEVLRSNVQRERVDVAVAMIGTGGQTVLDIGCGDAAIAEMIRKNGNEVVGMDFSKVICTAKDKKEIALVAGEASNLPFKDESFNSVFAGEIIEHMLYVNEFLQGIHRILKKDGKLVLTTPNIARLRNRLSLLLGDPSPWHEWDKPFCHIRYFTPQTLLDCLSKNGFRPVNYGSGRSLGEGPPIEGWDIFNEEERRVLKQIISRFTSHPFFLQTFIVIESRKVEVCSGENSTTP